MTEEIKSVIQEYYRDWSQRNEAHRNRLETLGQVFQDTEFIDSRPPTFFAGQLDAPIVIIGLNPGYSEKDKEDDWELRQKEDSFEDYWDFSKDFFQKCIEQEDHMQYYSSFSKFIRGLRGDEYKDSTSCPDYLRYLDGKIVNIDLIPYHSSKINGIDPNNPETRKVLEKYESIVKQLINLYDREYVIITGKNNFKFWSSKHSFNLTKSGKGRKRIDYTKEQFLGNDTIILKQFFPRLGLSTKERYNLGQELQ